MPDKAVSFYVIRHGQRLKGEDGRNLDELSPHGLKQLEASAERHLSGILLDAAYCSDMLRTRHAANHITAHRSDTGPDMERILAQPHPAFFVREYFEGEGMKELDRVESVIGKLGTAADWLKFYSPAQRIANGRLAAFREIAGKLHETNPKVDRVLNVLVADHAPFANLGALNPAYMGPVGLADVVRIDMQKGKAGWNIVQSEHLRCPLA